MSDASTPKGKISREGIVLIKSFEGFRPRAVPRAEGGWIIGYGHTLSAREGATVSEADAELLLRYDLLPIEKSVNAAAPADLNQHQFDALVSFGFSVGLERFETSDVLARLTGGAPAEAGEAMMAWPAADIPSAGVRRRSAERALFGADPALPISLAQLLTAPVPETAEAIVRAEPEPDQHETPETQAEADVADPVDSRVAAVAALLGEPDAISPEREPEPVEPAPIVPDFGALEPEPEAPTTVDAEPVVDNAATEAVHYDAPAVSAFVEAGTVADLTSAQAEDGEPTLAADPFHGAQGAAPEALAIEPRQAMAANDVVSLEPQTGAATSRTTTEVAALNVQRYAPYGTPIVGPLPFLQPEPPRAFAPDPSPSESAPETLVLTPPEEAPAPVLARPAWTAEEREEAGAVAQPETGLFGDDLSLTQGGQPLGRLDAPAEPPQTFDWSETGAFIIMGAVGLTAFGASMAAFRLASEQAGGDETSIIGWVLAVIGVACVGVSSLNLYRRFGLPGGDR